MLEREVLHVAVDGEELAPGEHGQLDVEDAVLRSWVLYDEEETEVTSKPGAQGEYFAVKWLIMYILK